MRNAQDSPNIPSSTPKLTVVQHTHSLRESVVNRVLLARRQLVAAGHDHHVRVLLHSLFAPQITLCPARVFTAGCVRQQPLRTIHALHRGARACGCQHLLRTSTGHRGGFACLWQLDRRYPVEERGQGAERHRWAALQARSRRQAV